MLVITKMYEEQHSRLGAKDFSAGFLTIKALKGLAIYNSGPQSGASQPHRHIQVVNYNRKQQPLTSYIEFEVSRKVFQKKILEPFKIPKFENMGLKHLATHLPKFDPEV